MKLSSPLQNSSFEIKEGRAFSLVIENKRLYRTYLENLYFQSSGGDGELVLSYDNAPVPFERNVCIIDAFVPFNINTKHMLSCISSAAEKKAVDEEHFMQTSKILAEIESYVYDLCFDFPFSVQCGKLSAASLIRSLQLCVADDYSSTLEALRQWGPEPTLVSHNNFPRNGSKLLENTSVFPAQFTLLQKKLLM